MIEHRHVLVERSKHQVSTRSVKWVAAEPHSDLAINLEIISSPDIYYETLCGCRIELGDAYVFFKDGSIYEPSLYLRDRSNTVERPISANSTLEQAESRNFFFVINAGWRNYYHWLLQTALSCFIIQDHFHGSDNRIVVPSITAQQKSILEFASVDLNALIICDDKQVIDFDRLNILNTNYGSFVKNPPMLMKRFAETIKSATKQRDSNALVYISRRDSGKRTVDNEAELEKRLQEIGFQIVILSQISFAEQVAIFSSADIIVGPHGAGLANLIFCKPSASIVELSSSHYINYCFLRLAQILDLDFEMHVFKSRDDLNKHKVRWSVDIEYTLAAVTSKMERLPPHVLKY